MNDFYRNHWIGYFGEAAVHIVLGNDWRLVFDYNDLRFYDHPDGVVNGFNFDVKTRIKKQRGLKRQKSTLRILHLSSLLRRIVSFNRLRNFDAAENQEA